jgi:hypothetical protein
MEDRPENARGFAGNSESEVKGRSKRTRRWIIGILVGLLLVSFLAWPVDAPFKMGSGSSWYAHRWKARLLACQSLDDVKRRFNCVESVLCEGGGDSRIVVAKPRVGRPHALIARFSDGKWIACAYRDSHGGWGIGGGTIVSRDSEGIVRVFFGHVCGDPRGYGRTLEEFYANLIRNSGIETLRERK